MIKELPWTEVGTEKFVAEMKCGRAVIEQAPPSIYGPLYSVRLELLSGEVVWHETFDIETAMNVPQYMLPLLDLVEGRLSDCGLVGETLDWCQQLISLEKDAIHWLRIEYIKEWIAHETGQTYQIVRIPIPDYPLPDFQWIEDGNRYYVETPHGRAIITETRDKNIVGSIRHRAEIIHRTGASLVCGSWVDFLEAEDVLKRHLQYLAHPEIRGHLPQMGFTLEICQRLLPEDADPIHSARLEMLGSHIYQALG